MDQSARPPDPVRTARLLLRRPVADDAPLIFARYAQDPEVTRYLTWRPHEHVGQTDAFVQRAIEAWDIGMSFPYVITLRDGFGPVGMIELRMGGHKMEIGYVLARDYWGHGYMTEAAENVTRWGLSQPSVYRVWALCDVDNTASARVLEKVGMRREGVLRRWILHPNISAEPRDCFCYAVTK